MHTCQVIVPCKKQQGIQSNCKLLSFEGYSAPSPERVSCTTWQPSHVHAGELEAETLALLEMEAVNHADFTPEVIACLPQVSDDKPWSIGDRERAVRRDFTGVRYAAIYTASCDVEMVLCAVSHLGVDEVTEQKAIKRHVQTDAVRLLH